MVDALEVHVRALSGLWLALVEPHGQRWHGGDALGRFALRRLQEARRHLDLRIRAFLLMLRDIMLDFPSLLLLPLGNVRVAFLRADAMLFMQECKARHVHAAAGSRPRAAKLPLLLLLFLLQCLHEPLAPALGVGEQLLVPVRRWTASSCNSGAYKVQFGCFMRLFECHRLPPALLSIQVLSVQPLADALRRRRPRRPRHRRGRARRAGALDLQSLAKRPLVSKGFPALLPGLRVAVEPINHAFGVKVVRGRPCGLSVALVRPPSSRALAGDPPIQAAGRMETQRLLQVAYVDLAVRVEAQKLHQLATGIPVQFEAGLGKHIGQLARGQQRLAGLLQSRVELGMPEEVADAERPAGDDFHDVVQGRPGADIAQAHRGGPVGPP
mmetsp:Transcript_50336/g.146309  ORF Transcript_50336/g.146309 Transcript_50336/m.146309 type:complete len:383 (-) Transcript_50336:775-1923(-)